MKNGFPFALFVALSATALLVGYSLFLRDGQVVFAVRVKTKVQEITAGGTVTGRTVSVQATLGEDGSRTLTVDGESITAQGPPLDPQPKMGLSAGEDQEHDVADYRKEQFRGSIEDLVLDVR